MQRLARGYSYKQIYFKQYQEVWQPTTKTEQMIRNVITDDPIPKIWKLATNNPKCFTNTQNMQVKNIGQSFTLYFNFPVYMEKFQNTGECKSLMEKNEWNYSRSTFDADSRTRNIISKCTLGKVKTMKTKMIYKSIYTY